VPYTVETAVFTVLGITTFQRRQSDLKIRGSWVRVWKLGVVGMWVLNVQQTEARSTELSVSSPEFLFNIHKSLYFWKVTTLESVLISNSCTL